MRDLRRTRSAATGAGTTRRRVPRSPQEVKKARQAAKSDGRRGPRPVGRPSKIFAGETTGHGIEIVKGRAPTQQERDTARAEAVRVERELKKCWHDRGETRQMKTEIKRQRAIADGGYIEMLPVKDVKKKESRKRGRRPRIEEEEEEDIDEKGYRPGEYEKIMEELRRRQLEDEPDMDEYGNIISPDTEIAGPTKPHNHDANGSETNIEDHFEELTDDLGDLDDDLFEEELSPPPPSKKRRSTGSGRL
ncbi:MAG: hypothetical protein Q9166_006913 [cf. Caloplaca sp. 2 TL-2023]